MSQGPVGGLYRISNQDHDLKNQQYNIHQGFFWFKIPLFSNTTYWDMHPCHTLVKISLLFFLLSLLSHNRYNQLSPSMKRPLQDEVPNFEKF